MLIYPCGNRLKEVPGNALYMMFANNEPGSKSYNTATNQAPADTAQRTHRQTTWMSLTTSL